MENHRLNWAPQANCHQCKAFELERQQEKEANAKSQRSAQTKKNHLAQRYASINKRKKQHNDCFHADLDTLKERSVNISSATTILYLQGGPSNLILSVQVDPLLQVSKDFMPAEIQTV